MVQNTSTDEINQLEWGFIPSWADNPDDGPRPINARAETVAEKPMFRSVFENRRCLIPADGFYEWKGERGHKQPYRVQRVGKELYAYAGLWEEWSSNGETRTTLTILTTEPNYVAADIHDRMPVILLPDEEEEWLTNDDPDELQDLLDPFLRS